MAGDEPRIRPGFLSDTQSQLLCLQDALATGAGPVMVHALRAVSEARGLTRTAHEGRVAADELAALLDRTSSDHDPNLLAVMSSLIARLSRRRRGDDAGKSDNQ